MRRPWPTGKKNLHFIYKIISHLTDSTDPHCVLYVAEKTWTNPVYCHSYMEHAHIMCGQNSGLYVPDGTYSFHRALKILSALKMTFISNFLLSSGATAPRGPGPPHSRGYYITYTQNDTKQTVGLLWTSDHLVAETFT
jgi:hypothetical protein